MENRTKIIPVKVNEKENEILKEKADEKGLPLSTYLRVKGLE